MALPPRIGIPAAAFVATILAACGSVPPTSSLPPDSAHQVIPAPSPGKYFALDDPLHSQEMVIYALGLLDTGYRFGGRNPEAGLDCSGMVSYIVEQVSGRRLPHNAARIAAATRPIALSELAPGDLVFFNTRNQRHSHMGIYLGGGKFVHAPSSKGRVRIERLDNPYFKPRIDGARSLLAGG